jgi:hypothetical protein
MRYSIQLYVDGQRVEMFNDEGVSITSSIQNVRDIGKVFSDYSQSFSVPASRQNNKIFKHYYNPDVDNGFDARVKADAVIEINYQPFKTGKIRLDEVEMKGNKAYAYKLTFFGGLVSLKDLLGEDQLEDLTWLANFNTEYTYLNVRTYLQSGRDITVDSVYYSDAIITPLISAEQRWYYSTITSGAGNLSTSIGSAGADFTNMKYAIRLWCIIKAIEKRYTTSNGFANNIAFSDDFFSTSNSDFYGLYMWLHREKGKIDLSEPTSTYLNKFPITSWQGTNWSADNFEIWDIDAFRASKYNMQLDVNVSSSLATFDVFVERNGSVVQSFPNNTGSTSYAFTAFDLTTNGNYRVRIQHTASFNVQSSTNIFLTRYDSSGTQTNTFTFTGSQSLTTVIDFDINSNMPKIKVIDFLTGLFKMFNLTAYDDNGTIVVKPLDDFYAGGDSVDITKYVDSSSSTISPSTLYNEISFKYTDTKSLFAQRHFEAYNYEWGEESYNIENKYDGDKYELVVPFAHHKYERLYDDGSGNATAVQWGWSVDKLNDNGTGQTYIGAPLVFYAYQQTGTNIRVTDGVTPVDLGVYFIPSNSIILSDIEININFKAELNEYTNTVFTQTLFNNYYSDYISDVFDVSRRIIRVTAHLPLSLLSGSKAIKLEDEIILNQRAYKINQVTYNIGDGKADFELINIV